MKRTLTLLLALVLVVALFAGCAGNKPTPTSTPAANTPAANTPAANTPAPGSDATPAPTAAPVLVENGKEAIYDIEYNKYGVPVDLFSYEKANALPLTTKANEPFTFFFAMTESSISKYSFDDLAELYSYKELYERTGVSIEYRYYTSANVATQYSTMLAGDDLCDVMMDVDKYYPQSMVSGVNEGYFANFYDYLEYMPCYQWAINNYDDDVWDFCYAYDKMMPLVISINEIIYYPAGLVVRGDFLDKLNMKPEDIRTVDEMYKYLSRVKKEVPACSWPALFGAAGDFFFGGVSGAFNTYGSLNIVTGGGVQPYVMDGVVKFPYCSEELYEYVKEVSKWYAEGLIDPDMASYKTLSTLTTPMTKGIGASVGMVSGIKQWTINNSEKDAYFVGLPHLVQNRGDTLHIKAFTSSHLTTMHFAASADCTDLPLLCSWIDYWYGQEGYMLSQYGQENVSYTLDENGQVWWTELIYKNPNNLTVSECWDIYATNSLGRRNIAKGNYYAGAAANFELSKIWDSPYDKAYVFPTSITLSEEDGNKFANMFADLSTYIIESYTKFITGDKPLSDWDNYVSECKKLKLDECIKIYQDTYDNWLANKATRYGKE